MNKRTCNGYKAFFQYHNIIRCELQYPIIQTKEPFIKGINNGN